METNLPPYLYDDTGALKEWATTAFDENNEHRHLSHLYCAWPLMETRGNARLTAACKQAVENRKSENEASHALVHRSLIAARLQDRAALTDALVNLMNHKIRYNSLMTNHDYDRGSCYCTDFAIGYLGIVHEALVYSMPMRSNCCRRCRRADLTGTPHRTKDPQPSHRYPTAMGSGGRYGAGGAHRRCGPHADRALRPNGTHPALQGR